MNAAPVVHVAEAASTQDLAKQLAREDAAHGTLVWADQQSSGRGRQGRSWLSVPEALLVSCVLRPQLPLRLATRLPLVVCARLMNALALPLFCKWPNDLLIAAPTDAPRLGPFRKVGGVLVEATDVTRDVLGCVVVGVGINVRGAVLAEIAAIAGTLADVGEQRSVATLVGLVQHALMTVPAGMGDAAFAQVRAELNARSATLGRRVEIDGVVGVARDIDADGALVVQRDDGSTVAMRVGDALLAD